jgi:hypothetical protein
MERELRLRVAEMNLQRQGRIFEIVLFFEFFGHGSAILTPLVSNYAFALTGLQ